MYNYLTANEWTGPDEQMKVVKVILDNTKFAMFIQTHEGMPLRSVNLSVYEVVTVHVCPKNPFTVLIELPKSYDLVSG